jgi:ubiquinone/menaquinone biosynthesis C-methylase UbiE
MFMHKSRQGETSSQGSTGIVITISAWLYDLIVRWLVMHGKERTFRRMTANLAGLQSGEAVLDVGCGTGTQALVAKERVGGTGHVCGIDPSRSLLSAARRKAKRAGLHIDFQPGGIEHIPTPSQSFDVVLSTFMMHHVPDHLKYQGLTEIARILKRGGRLLIIDFKRSEEQPSRPEQFGAGEIALQDLPALLLKAGFSQIETGEMPFRIRSVSTAHPLYGFIRATRR